tara:strand:- start:1066 stop:1704 length:639 start_codon:yes stop_codon:yes gene_type:complete
MIRNDNNNKNLRMFTFIDSYLNEVSEICSLLNRDEVKNVAEELIKVRDNSGRIFFIGVGGSAGNASHAVCDLRKLTGIECYAPSDNVSELTARTNDEGWDTIFSAWLEVSKLSSKDLLFVFSVGGGSRERNISPGLVNAIELAQKREASVVGIIGKEEGYTRRVANASILVPTVNKNHITPHSESFQTILWHMFASLPELKINPTKWESAVL